MKIKYGKHNGGIRFTALVVAFVFTATSVTWTTSANAAPAEVTTPIYASIDTLAIPAEMGTISKNFLQDNGGRMAEGGESALASSTIHLPQPGKTVILIQDAHAVIDAQENIAKILGHLRKSYGVNLTALEGAKGPLEPILLRTFPVASVKNRVISGYEKRAELSGPEMAAVFGNGPEKFQGMEEWGLYEQNYSAYLRAQEKKSSLVTRWNAFKQKLDSERAKVYSPQLNEFQIARENFLNERASLMDLLVYFSGFSSLLKASSGYQELPGLIASIGYEKSGKQDALVPLVRQIADEFKVKYLRGLGVKTEMNFYNRYQAFLTGQITAGQMLQYLVQLGREQGKGVKLTPALKKLLGHAELLSEIKGSRIYDELQRFLPELESSLIKNSAEREIAEKYQKLFLLKEMIELELTHESLAEYQKEPEAYLSLMADPTFKQDLVPALEFYQAALARDQAFMGKIDAMMKSEKQKTVAVVAGGFHTNGLERILKEQGVAYAVVTPKIASLEGIENYAKVMKGDVSFKEYLKTTYFDGLMRHASKTLADALPITDRVQTLKLWRDDVIRDLAKQGRIAEAGKYLPYIDEQLKVSGEVAEVGPKRTKEEILDIVKKELEKFKKDSLERIWKTFEFQLGIFTDGLRQLVSKKELNTQTVSDLLSRASNSKPSFLAVPLSLQEGVEIIRLRAVATHIPGVDLSKIQEKLTTRETLLTAVGTYARPSFEPIHAALIKRTAMDLLEHGVNSERVLSSSKEIRPVSEADLKEPVGNMLDELVSVINPELSDPSKLSESEKKQKQKEIIATQLAIEMAGQIDANRATTSTASEIPGASVKRNESREGESANGESQAQKALPATKAANTPQYYEAFLPGGARMLSTDKSNLQLPAEKDPDRWKFFETSLEQVNMQLLGDKDALYEKIKKLAAKAAEKGETVRIVDWGVGNGRALIEIAERLKSDGITNVELFGFGNLAYKNWEKAPVSITFIRDEAENLARFFEDNSIDFMFSNYGIFHLEEAEYKDHLRELFPKMKVGGEIIHTANESTAGQHFTDYQNTTNVSGFALERKVAPRKPGITLEKGNLQLDTFRLVKEGPSEDAKMAALLDIAKDVAKKYPPKNPDQCKRASQDIRESYKPYGMCMQRSIYNNDANTSKTNRGGVHRVLEVIIKGQAWVVDTQLRQFNEIPQLGKLDLTDEFVDQYVYPADEYYSKVPAFKDEYRRPDQKITTTFFDVTDIVPPVETSANAATLNQEAIAEGRSESRVNQQPLDLAGEKKILISKERVKDFEDKINELYTWLDVAGIESTKDNIETVLDAIKAGIELPEEIVRDSDAAEPLRSWMSDMSRNYPDIFQQLQVTEGPEFSTMVLTPGDDDVVLILGLSKAGKSSLAAQLEEIGYSLGAESEAKTSYVELHIGNQYLLVGSSQEMKISRARGLDNKPIVVKKSLRAFGPVKAIVLLNRNLDSRSKTRVSTGKLSDLIVPAAYGASPVSPYEFLYQPLYKSLLASEGDVPVQVLKVNHGLGDNPEGYLAMARAVHQEIKSASTRAEARAESRVEGVVTSKELFVVENAKSLVDSGEISIPKMIQQIWKVHESVFPYTRTSLTTDGEGPTAEDIAVKNDEMKEDIKRGHVTVARGTDGKIVGYVIHTAGKISKSGYVAWLVVRKDLSQRGIGTQLMDAAGEWFRKRKVNSVKIVPISIEFEDSAGKPRKLSGDFYNKYFGVGNFTDGKGRDVESVVMMSKWPLPGSGKSSAIKTLAEKSIETGARGVAGSGEAFVSANAKDLADSEELSTDEIVKRITEVFRSFDPESADALSPEDIDKTKKLINDGFVTVMRQDKEIAGYVIHTVDANGSGHIRWLIVRKDFQGLEIGTKLMNAAGQWFRDRNATSVLIEPINNSGGFYNQYFGVNDFTRITPDETVLDVKQRDVKLAMWPVFVTKNKTEADRFRENHTSLISRDGADKKGGKICRFFLPSATVPGASMISLAARQEVRSETHVDESELNREYAVRRKLENGKIANTVSIGDQHGESQVLEEILKAAKTAESGEFYFHGDLFDRGKNNKRNWEILMELMEISEKNPKIKVHYILGNHDELMIKALILDDQESLAKWFLAQNGGHQTYAQLGPQDARKLALDLLMIAEIYSMDDMGYLHVHGGVPTDQEGNPLITLQNMEDMQKELERIQGEVRKALEKAGELGQEISGEKGAETQELGTDTQVIKKVKTVKSEEWLNFETRESLKKLFTGSHDLYWPDDTWLSNLQETLPGGEVRIDKLKLDRLLKALGVSGVVFAHYHLEKLGILDDEFRLLCIDTQFGDPGHLIFDKKGIQFKGLKREVDEVASKSAWLLALDDRISREEKKLMKEKISSEGRAVLSAKGRRSEMREEERASVDAIRSEGLKGQADAKIAPKVKTYSSGQLPLRYYLDSIAPALSLMVAGSYVYGLLHEYGHILFHNMLYEIKGGSIEWSIIKPVWYAHFNGYGELTPFGKWLEGSVLSGLPEALESWGGDIFSLGIMAVAMSGAALYFAAKKKMVASKTIEFSLAMLSASPAAYAWACAVGAFEGDYDTAYRFLRVWYSHPYAVAVLLSGLPFIWKPFHVYIRKLFSKLVPLTSSRKAAPVSAGVTASVTPTDIHPISAITDPGERAEVQALYRKLARQLIESPVEMSALAEHEVAFGQYALQLTLSDAPLINLVDYKSAEKAVLPGSDFKVLGVLRVDGTNTEDALLVGRLSEILGYGQLIIKARDGDHQLKNNPVLLAKTFKEIIGSLQTAEEAGNLKMKEPVKPAELISKGRSEMREVQDEGVAKPAGIDVAPARPVFKLSNPKRKGFKEEKTAGVQTLPPSQIDASKVSEPRLFENGQESTVNWENVTQVKKEEDLEKYPAGAAIWIGESIASAFTEIHVVKLKDEGGQIKTYIGKHSEDKDLDEHHIKPQAEILNYLNGLNGGQGVAGICEAKHFVEVTVKEASGGVPASTVRMILFEEFDKTGATLDATVSSGKMNPHELVGVMLQVIGIIEKLHEVGVYHWDIKPGNIWVFKVGNDWKVILFDFDAAFMTESEFVSRALQHTITVRYVNANRLRAALGDRNIQSDEYEMHEVYALAMTLLVMMADPKTEYPAGRPIHVVVDTILGKLEKMPQNEVSKKLKKVLRRAVAKGESGYATVAELKLALEDAMERRNFLQRLLQRFRSGMPGGLRNSARRFIFPLVAVGMFAAGNAVNAGSKIPENEKVKGAQSIAVVVTKAPRADSRAEVVVKKSPETSKELSKTNAEVLKSLGIDHHREIYQQLSEGAEKYGTKLFGADRKKELIALGMVNYLSTRDVESLRSGLGGYRMGTMANESGKPMKATRQEVSKNRPGIAETREMIEPRSAIYALLYAKSLKGNTAVQDVLFGGLGSDEASLIRALAAGDAENLGKQKMIREKLQDADFQNRVIMLYIYQRLTKDKLSVPALWHLEQQAGTYTRAWAPGLFEYPRILAMFLFGNQDYEIQEKVSRGEKLSEDDRRLFKEIDSFTTYVESICTNMRRAAKISRDKNDWSSARIEMLQADKKLAELKQVQNKYGSIPDGIKNLLILETEKTVKERWDRLNQSQQLQPAARNLFSLDQLRLLEKRPPTLRENPKYWDAIRKSRRSEARGEEQQKQPWQAVAAGFFGFVGSFLGRSTPKLSSLSAEELNRVHDQESWIKENGYAVLGGSSMDAGHEQFRQELVQLTGIPLLALKRGVYSPTDDWGMSIEVVREFMEKVDAMVDQCVKEGNPLRIFDMGAGTGYFALAAYYRAMQKGVKDVKIVASELQPKALENIKFNIRLAEKWWNVDLSKSITPVFVPKTERDSLGELPKEENGEDIKFNGIFFNAPDVKENQENGITRITPEVFKGLISDIPGKLVPEGMALVRASKDALSSGLLPKGWTPAQETEWGFVPSDQRSWRVWKYGRSEARVPDNQVRTETRAMVPQKLEAFIKDPKKLTLSAPDGASFGFQWNWLTRNEKERRVRVEVFKGPSNALIAQFDFTIDGDSAGATYGHEREDALQARRNGEEFQENAEFAVWVDKDYRDRNLGSVLLYLGHQLAKSLGALTMSYYNVSHNQSFYRKNGARQTTDAGGKSRWTVNLAELPESIPMIEDGKGRAEARAIAEPLAKAQEASAKVMSLPRAKTKKTKSVSKPRQQKPGGSVIEVVESSPLVETEPELVKESWRAESLLASAKPGAIVEILKVNPDDLSAVRGELRGKAAVMQTQIEKKFDERIEQLRQKLSDYGTARKIVSYINSSDFQKYLQDLVGEFGDTAELLSRIRNRVVFGEEYLPSERLADVASKLNIAKVARVQALLDTAVAGLVMNGKEPSFSLLMDRPGDAIAVEVLGMLKMLKPSLLYIYNGPGEKPFGRAWGNDLCPIVPFGKVSAVRRAVKASKDLVVSFWSKDRGMDNLGIYSILAEVGKIADPRLRELALTAVRVAILRFATFDKDVQKKILAEPSLIRSYLEQFGIASFIQFDSKGLVFNMEKLVGEYTARQSIDQAA